MERLDEVLIRVLANCRIRMDKRQRKSGATVEAAPQVTRGQGGVAKSLAGKNAGCEKGATAPIAFHRRGQGRSRDKGLPAGRLEAAE
jgi:hypothetical protein